MFVANIPLAASLLPVVEFLSGSVPGAHSKVLIYYLTLLAGFLWLLVWFALLG